MKWATWKIALAVVLACTASVARAGSATVTCTAPTENTDGSPLTDLAGYRYYFRCGESNSYDDFVEVVGDPAPACGHTFDELPDDTTCWFVATALNESGVESAYSNEVSKLLPPLSGESPGKPKITLTWSEGGDVIREPWTFQPPVGTPVNSDLVEWFNASQAGVWNIANAALKNAIAGSVAGDATFPATGTHEFTSTPVGLGMTFDVSAGDEDGIGFSGSDFWNDEITQLSGVFAFTIDDPSSGPNILLTIGNGADGFCIQYGPNSDIMSFVFQDGSTTEFSTAGIFSPDSHHYLSFYYNAGSLRVYADGDLVVSTDAAPTSIPANSSNPGLGGGTGTTASSSNFEDEWGGVITLAGVSRRAIPEQLAQSLSMNPWQLFEPQTLQAFIPGGDTVQAAVDAPSSAVAATIDPVVDVDVDATAPASVLAATVEPRVDVDVAIDAPAAEAAASVDAATQVSADIDAPPASASADVTPTVDVSATITAPAAELDATVVPVVDVDVTINTPAATAASTVSADALVQVAVDIAAAVVAATVDPVNDVSAAAEMAAAQAAATVLGDAEVSVAAEAPGAAVAADVEPLVTLQAAIESAAAAILADVETAQNDVTAAIAAPAVDVAAAIDVEIDLSVTIETPTMTVSATISGGQLRTITAGQLTLIPKVGSSDAELDAKITAGIASTRLH